MVYEGRERRKYPRLDARFFISYKPLEEDKLIDVTQAKNISLGGVLLNTNREFAPGTKLSLKIRLPSSTQPVSFIGKVIECRSIVRNMIYETRVELIAQNKKDEELFKETLDLYIKERQKK
ncbi:MAG: PilZ domain-containing protein [Candidatus Omnitrophica bacterium]|nr:PilZ domain-containing protein [Candidatus Omnitrophota bacterium]